MDHRPATHSIAWLAQAAIVLTLALAVALGWNAWALVGMVLAAAGLIITVFDRDTRRLGLATDGAAVMLVLAGMMAIILLLDALLTEGSTRLGLGVIGVLLGIFVFHLGFRQQLKWAAANPRQGASSVVRWTIAGLWLLATAVVVGWSAVPLIEMVIPGSQIPQYVPFGFYFMPLLDSSESPEWAYVGEWLAVWGTIALSVWLGTRVFRQRSELLFSQSRLPASVVYGLAMIVAALLVAVFSSAAQLLDHWSHVGLTRYEAGSASSWGTRNLPTWTCFGAALFALAAVVPRLWSRSRQHARIEWCLLLSTWASVAVFGVSLVVHWRTMPWSSSPLITSLYMGSYSGMGLSAMTLVWSWGWYLACTRIRDQYMDRLANRRCLACGYDLRAGHEQCPECGRTPALDAGQSRLVER